MMDKIGSINRLQTKQLTKEAETTPQAALESFSEIFKSSLNKVNNAQIAADKMTEQLAAGKVEDLHQVMISAQKANVSLQATVEVRNKVIEAYQEIMRMQI